MNGCHRPRSDQLTGRLCHALSILVLGSCCLLASGSALVACGSAKKLTASPEDYGGYRKIRLEREFVERLGAAWDYLERHPKGAFRPEVKQWFEGADERYLVRHWDDLSNLQRYAARLRGAPRVGIVEARIVQIEGLRERVTREEQVFLDQERERQQAFDEAKQDRQSFVRSVTRWAALLSTLKDFGKPRDAWEPAFQTAFFEEDVPGNCFSDSCRKRFLSSFEIPRQDGLETRAASFRLTLTLQEERLKAAELAGEGLFDRFSEAATGRAVDPGDLQARAEAIGTATQLLRMALSAGFSESTCERDAISPVVIARECDGRAIFAIVAEQPGDDDRVVIVESQ